MNFKNIKQPSPTAISSSLKLYNKEGKAGIERARKEKEAKEAKEKADAEAREKRSMEMERHYQQTGKRLGEKEEPVRDPSYEEMKAANIDREEGESRDAYRQRMIDEAAKKKEQKPISKKAVRDLPSPVKKKQEEEDLW